MDWLFIGYFSYVLKSKFPKNLLNNLSHSFIYLYQFNKHMWNITMGGRDGDAHKSESQVDPF